MVYGVYLGPPKRWQDRAKFPAESCTWTWANKHPLYASICSLPWGTRLRNGPALFCAQTWMTCGSTGRDLRSLTRLFVTQCFVCRLHKAEGGWTETLGWFKMVGDTYLIAVRLLLIVGCVGRAAESRTRPDARSTAFTVSARVCVVGVYRMMAIYVSFDECKNIEFLS